MPANSPSHKGVDSNRVLSFCRRFLARHDRMPYKREICTAFGLKSTFSAKHHLDKLVKEGKLVKVGRLTWKFPRD